MKKIIISTAAILGFFVSDGTQAIEPGVSDPNPIGVTLGFPTDLNPPPGFSIGWRGAMSSGPLYDGSGNKLSNTRVHVWTTGPFFGWSMPRSYTSWLGASNFAFVNFPLVGVNTNLFGAHSTVRGWSNPVIAPINLSWALGDGFFINTGFLFNPPLGSISGPDKTSGIGQNFWTFEPAVSVGWHNRDYDLTVHAWYDIDTVNRQTQYRSGNTFFVELGALRKFGKFKIGPIAAYSAQVTNDQNRGSSYGTPGCSSAFVPLCTRPKTLTLGAAVGYSFGKVNLTAWLAQQVYTVSTAKSLIGSVTVGYHF